MGWPPKILPEKKNKKNPPKTRGEMAADMLDDPEQQKIWNFYFHRYHYQYADADLGDYKWNGELPDFCYQDLAELSIFVYLSRGIFY
jgi:hypothetical protein